MLIISENDVIVYNIASFSELQYFEIMYHFVHTIVFFKKNTLIIFEVILKLVICIYFLAMADCLSQKHPNRVKLFFVYKNN